MLSIILWTIGGLIALGVLFFLLKIFFMIMGVKKMLSIVKEEVEQLPQDYAQMRKEVENENGVAKPTANAARRVGLRWFKHWR